MSPSRHPQDEDGPQATLPPRFASVVAHELRNPLSAVKIALQTVGHGAALGAKDATRLSIALREVGTIERVLDLVLEWARPSALAREPASVEDLLKRVAGAVADAVEETGALVDVAADPTVVRVFADADRLALALSELVRNAVLAGTRGTPVRLRCERVADHVVFEVTNHGQGLTSEELERAFDAFWSGRARGVGLGLTVAREVARRHGGDVFLSRTPTGSVARLTISADAGAEGSLR